MGSKPLIRRYIKKKHPRQLQKPGGQILSAAGDAAMFMPELGQAKTLFAKTATEATLGREANGVLIRFGQEAETTKSLSTQSAAAAAHADYGEHGVSAMMKSKAKGSDFNHKVASVADVQAVFPIKQTGKKSIQHYTVILPHPVTDEVTQMFNNLFKPVK